MLVKIGFLTFLLSSLLCLILIVVCRKSGELLDNHNGVQNIHKEPVPRVGGLAILISCAIALAIFALRFKNINFIYLFLAALPISLAGLFEDIEHKLSPKVRLVISFISAFSAVFLLKATIVRTGIFFLDHLAKYELIAALFAAIAIAGVTNSINIIDGLNGLSSGTAMILLLAIGYIAFKVQDFFVLSVATLLGAAILGFFIWNYPYGKIFLGDGGAYLIGFVLAVISIMLVKKSHEVSPWFPILVLIYPIFETLFSIYRRSIKKHRSPLFADTLHLHSLFYRRVVPSIFRENNIQLSANPATSPFIWILCSFSVIPAVLFSNSTLLLIICTAIFILLYLVFYKLVVKFKLSSIIKRG